MILKKAESVGECRKKKMEKPAGLSQADLRFVGGGLDEQHIDGICAGQ